MGLDLSNLKAQPFILVNPKGLIEQLSPGFSQIFFPVETGNFLAQYIHPEDRIEFQSWLRALNHSQHQNCLVKNLRMVDQRGRVISAMVRPELVDNGHCLFWFWEAGPQNERGDYWETAITPAMEAVFSSILDGVFLVNVEGKIVEANQALCEMLGYHKFELLGLPVGRLFSDDAHEILSATQRFALIMKYGRIKEVNLTLKDHSGQKIEVNFSGAVIRGEGNQLVGILGVVRDLRESKIMRQLRAKTEELERAMEELNRINQVKDDFLSVVGHELRTPLSNILGYAEFLQEGGLSSNEEKEFIQTIYQESRRLARLVNEILDLSRLERGRLVYHYVNQPLEPIIEEAINSVRVEAEQKNIKITSKLNCPLLLWIDRDRIQQVIINLLGNAIKYSPAGREVRVVSTVKDDGALVSVQDQGEGIAKENLERVFDKFFRVENIEHHSQGAGLGLPIAKRIIEEGHQGRIWAESPGLGKGAIFYFWLPRIVKNGA